MVNLPMAFNMTSESAEEKGNGIISSLTVATWLPKRESEKKSEDASINTVIDRFGFLFRDLTYPENKSMIETGFSTDVNLLHAPLPSEKSFDSLLSQMAYIREKALGHLEKVTELFAELKESFEDTMSRQIIFFQIKENLRKLWEIDIPKNDYFLQAVSLLEDSLVYIKSEDLSKDQVEGILNVVEICKKIELSIDDVRRCGKILRSRKITTLPTLD